jgi:RNA polymerase sigma factor (sigma-70 family)
MKSPEQYKRFNDNEKLINYTLKIHFPNLLFDEDIRQIAAIGLWDACRNFNASLGYEFSTYAVCSIYKSILHSFRSQKEKHVSIISFSEPIKDNEGNATIEDVILDPNSEFIYDEIEQKEDIQTFFKGLTKREKDIIELRIQNHSQAEIAKKYSISQASISRLIIKLRNKWLNEQNICRR